jgi:hypothetical protein
MVTSVRNRCATCITRIDFGRTVVCARSIDKTGTSGKIISSRKTAGGWGRILLYRVLLALSMSTVVLIVLVIIFILLVYVKRDGFHTGMRRR